MDSPTRANPGSSSMQRLQRQRAQVVRKLSIFSLVFVVLTVLGLIALYHLRIKAAEWGSSRTRPSSVPSRFLSALFTSTFPVSFVAQGNVNEGPDGPPFIAGHGPLARRSLGADSFSGDGTATTGFVVAEVPNCYHYRRAVNVVLFVSLSVLLVLQTVLCLVYRRTKHLFAAAVLFGLTLEVAGYGARVYMSYLPSNFGRVRLTYELPLSLGPLILSVASLQCLASLQPVILRNRIPLQILSRLYLWPAVVLVLVAGSEFLAALSTLPTQAKHAATGNKNDCLDTWSPVAKLSAAHSVGSDLSSLRTYFRRPCDLVLVLDLLNGATVVATTSLLALFHPARVIEAFPSRRLTSTGDIKSETVMTNDDKVNA